MGDLRIERATNEDGHATAIWRSPLDGKLRGWHEWPGEIRAEEAITLGWGWLADDADLLRHPAWQEAVNRLAAQGGPDA